MLLFALLSCEPDDVDTGDSAPAEETDYPEVTTCDTLEIYQDGEDPPHVGDVWTILLKCDDAVLLGASHVGLEPPEAADVAENVLTWAQVGTATIELQTGRFKTTREVTVLAVE